jgi:FkbM family methyltransferase
MPLESLLWRTIRSVYGQIEQFPSARVLQREVRDLLSRWRVTTRARLATGEVLHVDLASPVGSTIWLRGRYDAALVDFVLTGVRAGDVFLDVGANVGYYTAMAARAVGPTGLVIAVEPGYAALSLLCRSVVENRWSNVVVCSLAASGSPAVAHFDLSGDPGLSRIDSGGTYQVATARLDDVVLPLLAGRSIAAAKIDVEGHELEVLEGMTCLFERSPPRRVLVEAHSSKGERWVRQLFGWFSERGYDAVNPDNPAEPLDVGSVMRGVWNVGFVWSRVVGKN